MCDQTLAEAFRRAGESSAGLFRIGKKRGFYPFPRLLTLATEGGSLQWFIFI